LFTYRVIRWHLPTGPKAFGQITAKLGDWCYRRSTMTRRRRIDFRVDPAWKRFHEE